MLMSFVLYDVKFGFVTPCNKWINKFLNKKTMNVTRYKKNINDEEIAIDFSLDISNCIR